ncbi:MAG: hypothetical protein BAA04_04130 [Firmicutes bacterium ZCTH02-B6]|nr:MAG: hypothetical protein BAA04_04130 [Firmicutes bacterium ZCTH02-B6]
MTGTAFVRNGLFALILLLLAATIVEANLPFTRGVEEYLVFVLTTDFDYQPWIEQLRARLAGADLSWLPVLGDAWRSPANDPQR